MSYVIIGLIIVACIIHSVLKKSKETADQAVNDAIVPGVMNTLFDDVQMHPEGHLLDVKGSNIPLQTYSYLNSSGHHFFEVGRDRNNPEALKQRYTRELKWCRDMLDVFIS